MTQIDDAIVTSRMHRLDMNPSSSTKHPKEPPHNHWTVRQTVRHTTTEPCATQPLKREWHLDPAWTWTTLRASVHAPPAVHHKILKISSRFPALNAKKNNIFVIMNPTHPPMQLGLKADTTRSPTTCKRQLSRKIRTNHSQTFTNDMGMILMRISQNIFNSPKLNYLKNLTQLKLLRIWAIVILHTFPMLIPVFEPTKALILVKASWKFLAKCVKGP